MTAAEPARRHLVSTLERVAQGDRAALREVYELTSAKLYGICLHILGEQALAEDVLQEVYIHVWQGAGRFDPARASPITWLCMIARNRAIDWRRSSHRYEEALLAARGAAHGTAQTGEWDYGGDDRAGLLRRCMDALEESPRTSIRSAFFEGFTYSELAAHVDVPLATMKSWVRRGLAQLRRCIDNG
ncbi:sigma-70 family RNA polymerase sigma factor [Sphingomonas xinjiangensis]|uniref:RNA polymerase sigma factor n=1 Tax=Sphingomonas xinjiangensis TaxID=643568 RepID=A0A840YSK6_9SPHN|nr:sigma-70 family RNA polymerase sigma factor [Sphingomonas xinjiangensis]MBB5712650.1 RNA polymerase sigma-70 factor (ECF subfamily) [Sphingomonas xinjiangensis]